MTEALAPGLVQVRIGLHTGTPLVTHEGYVGGDVHRAARIAAAGHGGQVLVSSSTAQLIEHELTDLGEHRLKDLSAPERIYQLGEGTFPALKSLYRTNLPIPATPFLGREQELAEVLALLSAVDTRLLTLTGPGGTGKTRLALQAVAEASERYPDGVWWIPLAPLREPELVLETAAQVVGANDGLAEYIADKSMLCLFDNFEQVVEAGAELADLLASCPNVDFVVTSRERLRVRGEQTYPVPPLAEKDGAVLFSARARAVDPAFTTSEAVAELCVRLDLLPLALELAAARTALFSPEQLLERLSQRLDLLKGERDADPRQQTLRATIEWSCDLLNEREQGLFARLSVFAGGCSYEAAEQVAEADPDTLQSLLDKSLLRKRESNLGPRYWMLETIREFAADRLLHIGDSERCLALHADQYIALVREATASLETGEDQDVWLDRMQTDYPNIRASLQYVEHHDPARLLECVFVLRLYWRHRGYLAEGRTWLEKGLHADDGSPPGVRARALVGLSIIARAQGDLDGSWAFAEEGLGIAREAGDDREASLALTNLATIAADRHEIDRALVLQQESVEVARTLEDARPLAHGLNNLGFIKLIGGDAEGAIPAIEDALRMHTERGELVGLSIGLLNLGAAELTAGRMEAARDSFMKAVGTTAKLGSDEYLAYALQGVAATTVDLDPRRAAELLGAADRLLHETSASPEPVEQWVRQRALERVREALGDALQDAAAVGASLATTAAVERALSIHAP
jgi:predicted ATPase